MREPIVITGIGAVTPIGVGVPTYWDSLVRGVCGIGEIGQIDTSSLPIHRAAEVREFHPKDFMPTRLVLVHALMYTRGTRLLGEQSTS